MNDDVEVTIVVRFRKDREPDETEVRQITEELWLGDMVEYNIEDV